MPKKTTKKPPSLGWSIVDKIKGRLRRLGDAIVDRLKVKLRARGGAMVAKPYPLFSDGVEIALEVGWHRAHKHTDTPTMEQILEAQHLAVTNEIAERFDFPDPDPWEEYT